VYGVLGIAFDASHIVPTPDYTISTEEVYKELVPPCVDHYENLEVLCFADNLKRRQQKETEELPSWVADWNVDTNLSSFSSSAHLVNARPRKFTAGWSLDIGPLFSDDLSTVILRAFHIDDIVSVGEGSHFAWAREAKSQGNDHPRHRNLYGNEVDVAIVRTTPVLLPTLEQFPKGKELAQLFLKLCNYSGMSEHADSQISSWYHTSFCGRSERLVIWL
jgi:hypothetical protein